MCVICAAAKKRHMEREEVLEAIKHNSAGFFGFSVRNGERRTVRTLSDKEFMEFFDSVGDDEPWVMHARIPSRGEKSLDNVHGWEEDGIIFCHNMTISSIDGMMRSAKWEGTDSEFFFRHIFMPFFRGCGPDAYKDGKFCPDLDNLVEFFCGTINKFLFIMPDNRIVTYGTWVKEESRREDGKCAFIASNSSYKVYASSWPASRTRGSARTGARQYYDYEYGCWYEYDDDDDEYPAAKSGAKAADAKPSAAAKPSETSDKEAAKILRSTLGDVRICRIGLCNLVSRGAISLRAMPGDWNGDDSIGEQDDVEQALFGLEPRAFTDDTYEMAVAGLGSLGDDSSDAPPYGPEDFAADYASELAPVLLKVWGKDSNNGVVPLFATPQRFEAAAATLDREWRTFARVVGVALDFSAKSPASFACVADIAGKDGSRWKVGKARAEDVLEDESLDQDTVFRAVGKLLDFIKAEEAKAMERSLG